MDTRLLTVQERECKTQITLKPKKPRQAARQNLSLKALPLNPEAQNAQPGDPGGSKNRNPQPELCGGTLNPKPEISLGVASSKAKPGRGHGEAALGSGLGGSKASGPSDLGFRV